MAGNLTVNKIQLGDSATASNNFHVVNNVDGSMSINRGNVGASLGEVLSIGGTETVQRIMQFSAKNATGTEVLFTGIPSWAKEIAVMFSGVSTNGSSQALIQVGSGGVVASGYVSSSSQVTSAGAVNSTGQVSVGLVVSFLNSSSDLRNGAIRISNIYGNAYIAEGCINSAGNTNFMAGSITLTGKIDSVKITTINGTDTFDAGSINILVKG